MKKKEIILRELIIASTEGQRMTQLELSKRLGVSLSTVNNAIAPLVRQGAIEAKRTGLSVLDMKKLVIYLASVRNLQSDVVFTTRVDMKVSEIEKSMPEGVVYAAFSAYRFLYGDTPADYSEVYVYADEKVLEELKSRFPAREGPPNLYVLQMDSRLPKLSKNAIAPPIQIFIDLWNLREWYAKEFVLAMSKRLRLDE
jgi:transposase